MKSFQKGLLGLAVALVMALALSGSEAWGQGFTYDITPKASVKTGFFIKQWQGKPSLHVELILRNLSDQKERFKATMDVVGGPSVVAYIPVEGKVPAIEPKAEFTGVYPMYYGSFPKEFHLKVEVVPYE
jgi:hypothetical protein